MITRDYFGCDSNVFEIVTDKLNKAYKAVERGFVSFGYARAAGELARMGLARGSAYYYTSDLTYDYIKINADYRT